MQLSFSDHHNDWTVWREISVCLYSDGGLLVNEPLSTVERYGSAEVAGSVPAGGSDAYTVVFYAGLDDAGCGSYFSGYDGSGAYTSDEPVPRDNSQPSLGVNAEAPTLTRSAEGGRITPAVTVDYMG